MDLLEGDVELTEFEVIDAQSVKGVRQGANGFPFLMMKGLGDGDAAKDWAQWDADHGGKGKPTAAGDSKASAADAVARAKQTIADHKAGKKVSAADLKNAHEVHEAHLAHEAKLKAEGKSTTAAKPAAKPATKPAAAKPAAAKPVIAKKDLAKAGARDCPECGHGHDADHKGNTCTECGADLPAAEDAEKSAVGIIVKAVTDGMIDQAPDIDLGHQIMGLLARAIEGEAQEIGAGSYGETADVDLLNCAAAMISRWVGREAAPDEDDGDSAMMLMQSAAKALGVAGPLDGEDDTSKSQIAKEGADVDTETQTGGLAKAVEEAVTKAMAPLQERVKSLDAELAKVKATPVPTGMVLSRNVQVKTPGGAANDDLLAKAALYRAKADAATAPKDREGYLALARETEQEARTTKSE